MATFNGTAGDDNFTGTFTYDTFDLTQGGNDTAKGKAGGDGFTMGGAFNGGDRLDGGLGYDYVYLAGDYSAGLVVTGLMFASIESLNFAAGNSYDITFKDGANAALSGVVIYGLNLISGNTLKFDGSEETASTFSLYGGGGNDRLTGGEGGDNFYLYYNGGGVDFVSGRGGNDAFNFGDALTRDDRVNGGLGRDSIYLEGDYALNFRPNTITSVEYIGVYGGHDYKLTFDDANIAAGNVMQVYGAYSLLEDDKLIVNAAGETDGALHVTGGAGRDAFNTGAGNDTLDGQGGADVINAGDGDDSIFGGAGHDELTGGGGQDVFLFGQGATPFANPDLILDLSLGDVISVSGIDADTTTDFDQQFVLVSSFSGTAGELRLDYDSGLNRTFFLMDTDGDGTADERFAAVGNRTAFTNFEL